jgi:hypothetical protein
MSIRQLILSKSTAVTLPSFTPVRSGLLQRKCACGDTPGPIGECEAYRQKKLQRRPGNLPAPSTINHQPSTASQVPPIVHEVLRSPGEPLDLATRAFMESRFGHDFSCVRVHTDSRAVESARAVNAMAYAFGGNIVFQSHRYSLKTEEGRKLLAHELVHVMQQRGSTHTLQADLTTNQPGDAEEHEADAAAAKIMAGQTAAKSPISVRPSSVSIRRQADSTAAPSDGRPGCSIGGGVPNSTCSAYAANSWWLPFAYVNNATCACAETPNVPTAKCVRKFLQDRLAATSGWLKASAVAQKPLDNPALPAAYGTYQTFVQTFLTPQIYRDHVDAYASCCCSSGPAAYPAWVGVTSVPLPCAAVGTAIRQFGSCHGTPGTW